MQTPIIVGIVERFRAILVRTDQDPAFTTHFQADEEGSEDFGLGHQDMGLRGMEAAAPTRTLPRFDLTQPVVDDGPDEPSAALALVSRLAPASLAALAAGLMTVYASSAPQAGLPLGLWIGAVVAFLVGLGALYAFTLRQHGTLGARLRLWQRRHRVGLAGLGVVWAAGCLIAPTGLAFVSAVSVLAVLTVTAAALVLLLAGDRLAILSIGVPVTLGGVIALASLQAGAVLMFALPALLVLSMVLALVMSDRLDSPASFAPALFGQGAFLRASHRGELEPETEID